MRARHWVAGILACILATAAFSTAQRRSTSLPAPAAAPVPAPAADRPSNTPQLTAADVGAWADGYMPAALRQGKIAGAQIVVVKNGQVLFKKGYGYADVAAQRPMDPDAILMRIGSTSKLLTWTAVLQQVEAGKIDLTADVNRYLDFRIQPKDGGMVTMNDLMNHRAGFEEGLKDVLATDPAKLKSTERYLKENVRPFLFAPGEAPAYSNYGVALAGYIVQRVSGERFEDYVQRHILAPLKMTRTTFVQPLPPTLAPFASKGYRQSDQPASKFELVETAPAGSVSATGADMANYMIAMLQNGRFDTSRILRPETARLIRTPGIASAPGFDAMAHGFFHQQRNGRLVIGHGGDTIAFHTDLNLLPDENVGIFVSFNSRGEDNAVYGARERLFALFMDRYFPAPFPTTPPAIATAAADAQAIAGHYETSRRVETGFISLFYLMQQDQVVANDDGTVSVSSIEGKRFREIAPKLWREVGGRRQLAVTTLAGRRAIIDSANPVGMMQAAPFSRNSAVFLSIAGASVLVLLLTVIVWPIGAWIRRSYQQPPLATGRTALARRLTRFAALANLAYLAAWYTIVAPVLETQLDAYNADLDGVIRTLQVAAIVPVAALAIGLWNMALAFRGSFAWGVRIRSVIIALALLGFLWTAAMSGFIGWSLNY
ncbi:MAG: serine hydrolase domain-containing protein [Pseudomonadota bacterium]